MTPSHDAPDSGPTSFDDGPAPATLGLSRRELRAAERARALALGIDEADDAPVEEPTGPADTASAGATERPDTADAADGTASQPSDRSDGAGSGQATDEATTPAAEPLTAPGVGPDTSAILLSGGVLTRRQLRAIREAEEAARQQRGSEHGDAAAADAPAPVGADAPAEERSVPAVDDAPPAASSEPAVPPYVRYGRGSRATPRPRAPYGSAYRRTPASDAGVRR
jgi:hypothetical protein